MQNHITRSRFADEPPHVSLVLRLRDFGLLESNRQGGGRRRPRLRRAGFASGRSDRDTRRVRCEDGFRIAVGLSRWPAEKLVRLQSVSSRHFDQYLRYRARQQRICEGDATALKQLLDFLRDSDVIPVEKIRQRRPSPFERHVRTYARYLREERVLATATIINYVRFIRKFLKDCFGSAPVRLSQLCAGDVVRFIQRQAPRLHLKTAKLLPTALGSFLQYTRYPGYVRLDLAADLLLSRLRRSGQRIKAVIPSLPVIRGGVACLVNLH